MNGIWFSLFLLCNTRLFSIACSSYNKRHNENKTVFAATCSMLPDKPTAVGVDVNNKDSGQ